MKPKLAHHLASVRATVAEVQRIVDLHKYPDDPRTVLVRGLVATLDQHHRGVMLSIDSGLVGSAYALVRDIIRGARLGLWINACASSDKILSIHQGEEVALSIPEMNMDIEAAYQGDPFFVELRDRWVAKIDRYSSETIVRVGQFCIDPKSLAQEDEEVVDAVTTATLCIVMLASKFLATQKHAVESKQVEALATGYARNAA